MKTNRIIGDTHVLFEATTSNLKLGPTVSTAPTATGPSPVSLRDSHAFCAKFTRFNHNLVTRSAEKAENSGWHQPCMPVTQRPNLVNEPASYFGTLTLVSCVAILVLMSAMPAMAQVKEVIPRQGTFYSMQNPKSPPLPYNPFHDLNLPVYSLSNGIYLLDDRSVDYDALREEMAIEMALEQFENELLYGGGNTPSYLESYSESDLWIEILAMSNNFSHLTLHGTKVDKFYQLLKKPVLTAPRWTYSQIMLNSTSTNQIYFDPEPTAGLTNTFYRGVEGNRIASIFRIQDAIEPNTPQGLPGQSGLFFVFLDDALTYDLDVGYEISGVALNGTDFKTLSGTLTIPSNSFGAIVEVTPIEDSLIEFGEPLTLRLVLTNGYLVDPGAFQATIFIQDNFGTNEIISTVVTGLTEVAGIDYHPPTQSLLVSQHFFNTADPDFLRINSSGVVTAWSGITNLNEEKKICVVQTTANGFTEGEMYFGTPVNGVIGKISADGTVTNLSWAVLTTNNLAANSLIRGSLYVDQTGIFGHDLIAVTGGGENEGGEVWRVNSTGQATLLAAFTNVFNPHLEGVITLTNDFQKWGPLAGKIVTGAESAQDENFQPKPLIHAIDTNGTLTSFALGIAPEDFDIIPTNQDLYITSYNEGSILKLSKTLLTNFWGDLLVSQEGPGIAPALFILHWNSTTEEFEIRVIPVNPECGSQGIEHVAFAPINLPNIPCQ